jgi:hypothetical protein
MSGLLKPFMPIAPLPAPVAISATQTKQEARAEAQTREQTAQAAARRRAQRTGGIRLLMSPVRQEGPGQMDAMETLGIGKKNT